MMARNQPFYDLSVGTERAGSRFLVGLHEPAIANHVGGQNSGETALHIRSPLKGRLAAVEQRIYAPPQRSECLVMADSVEKVRAIGTEF
jgi:hypothetical protein